MKNICKAFRVTLKNLIGANNFVKVNIFDNSLVAIMVVDVFLVIVLVAVILIVVLVFLPVVIVQIINLHDICSNSMSHCTTMIRSKVLPTPIRLMNLPSKRETS